MLSSSVVNKSMLFVLNFNAENKPSKYMKICVLHCCDIYIYICVLYIMVLIKENVIVGSKAPHINRPLIIGVALVNTGIPLENTEKYSQGRP